MPNCCAISRAVGLRALQSISSGAGTTPEGTTPRDGFDGGGLDRLHRVPHHGEDGLVHVKRAQRLPTDF